MILSAEKNSILLSGYISCTCVIYLHNCFHLEISLLIKIGMCYCSFITERDQEVKVYFETWAKTWKKILTTITSRNALINI